MSRSLTTVLAAGSLAAGVLLGGVALGPSADATGPRLYQRSFGGANLVLGPSSAPTTVLTTGVLPVGLYHVTTVVGAVVGRSVNVVCALGTTLSGDTVNGDFGATGNGSGTSGTGPNGVYGDAVMNHTVRIASPGDRLKVVCNAGAPGTGSYVGGASLTAQPLGSAVQF